MANLPFLKMLKYNELLGGGSAVSLRKRNNLHSLALARRSIVVEKGDPEGSKTGIPEEVPPEELQRRDTPPAFLKIFNYWIVKENRTALRLATTIGKEWWIKSVAYAGRKEINGEPVGRGRKLCDSNRNFQCFPSSSPTAYFCSVMLRP